ncbi:MAG: hypothetical protein AAF597_06425 [Bacteroidota bacterium]
MKPFNFSSPYSRLGLFLAASICGAALLIKSGDQNKTDAVSATDLFGNDKLTWKLVEPPTLDFEDFDPGAADIPNFRDPAAASLFGETKAPCFEVKIDPSVPGADEDYRTDMFAGSTLVNGEAFTEALKATMTEEFKNEVWARVRNEIKG